MIELSLTFYSTKCKFKDSMFKQISIAFWVVFGYETFKFNIIDIIYNNIIFQLINICFNRKFDKI